MAVFTYLIVSIFIHRYVYAYNYSSKESLVEYDDLDNLLISSVKTINKEKISDYISLTINDVHFWKSCLILSLLFFGIEIALLKLIKT